jgi:hypothetical protein
MADDLSLLAGPEKIVELGEALYAERHKARLERDHIGHFVAIDVLTGEAYVGEFPEQALDIAEESAPDAILHLIRIGSRCAFSLRRMGLPLALSGASSWA